MTPEQRAKFQELLGNSESDPLYWDELPVSIKRVLLFAAGLPISFGYTSWTWASFTEVERKQLNDASKEFIAWAEFSRNKLEAEKTEQVAA